MKTKSLLSVMAILAVLCTGCEKNKGGGASSFDGLVEYGKYLGMKLSDVTKDIADEGWSTCTREPEHNAPSRFAERKVKSTYYDYTKEIEGVEMYLSAGFINDSCIVVYVEGYGMSDPMSIIECWYNKIGASYYFTNIQQTADFSSLGVDDEEFSTTSYEDGKKYFSSYHTFMDATWYGGKGQNGVNMIGTISEEDGNDVGMCFGHL